ncbi:MAG: hypothetical protein P9M14_15250 [Candidatus Alcyoniella australis]|nr:hypothetical protein [Candidatus Alcyoniella australis]
MKTSASQSLQIETIHGFRVLPISPVTKPFERALKLIESRVFADPSCVIVKTKPGGKSRVTHAGGRYIHPALHYGPTVVSMMKDQGIEPPPMPFILAPGEKTLLHEWGHHVDFCWSGNYHLAIFSVRWFSQFYHVSNLGVLLTADRLDRPAAEHEALIANGWFHLATELFADLFEDWMQDKPDAGWGHCDPVKMNINSHRQDHITQIELLEDVSAADVREKTNALLRRD